MERITSTATPLDELERFLADDAPEAPAEPEEPEVQPATRDDFDAQILAGLVSP
jgi:hypothetical protein